MKRIVATSYESLLGDIKERIRSAQKRAVLAANAEMTALYWDIGRNIVERQRREGWGAAVIERLARDIRKAFPTMKGMSPRNIWRMRSLYIAYSHGKILPQAVAEIPWGHNVILMEKVKEQTERLWYAGQVVACGWSRSTLVQQIECGLYRRQGKAVTNFGQTLPAPQANLAIETLKDPYLFDFLSVSEAAHERTIESNLVKHIREFLLELGSGFSFVGEQYRIEVSQNDYFIDLLFYHTRLHCYVVIELKSGAFKPEFAGQINFYLSAVDDLLKAPEDNPSIGILLCATKDRVLAEYALRDIRKPIGVAEWRAKLTTSLPRDLKGSLPTIEEIEEELKMVEKTTR